MMLAVSSEDKRPDTSIAGFDACPGADACTTFATSPNPWTSVPRRLRPTRTCATVGGSVKLLAVSTILNDRMPFPPNAPRAGAGASRPSGLR